jgi:hypothetical protein
MFGKMEKWLRRPPKASSGNGPDACLFLYKIIRTDSMDFIRRHWSDTKLEIDHESRTLFSVN